MMIYSSAVKAYQKHCRRQPPLTVEGWQQLRFGPALTWLTALFFIGTVGIVIYIYITFEPSRGSTTGMWVALSIFALLSLLPLYYFYLRFFVEINWNEKAMRLSAYPFSQRLREWRDLEFVATDYHFGQSSLRFKGHNPIKFSHFYHGHNALVAEAMKQLGANRSKDKNND